MLNMLSFMIYLLDFEFEPLIRNLFIRKPDFSVMWTTKALTSLGICAAWPLGYKTFFMLNSAEHEIYLLKMLR